MISNKVWSVLAVGLFAASVNGCGAEAADMGEVDGAGALPHAAADEDDASVQVGNGNQLPGDPTTGSDDPIPLQTPPIKVKLFYNESPLLALVALNGDVGRYTGQTEYWHASQSLVLQGDVQLETVPLSLETETSIADWVAPLSPAFSTRRRVEAQEWTRGPVTVSSELVPYLLWAPHPDDDREVLGLLLETNRDGQLVGAAWYRSSPPDDSGLAFRSQRWTQPMTLVRDRDGVPSADPSLIREATWYTITMPMQ